VVDSHHPHALQHIETVEDTLAEIEVPHLPIILVLNKSDLWESPIEKSRFADLAYDHSVPISARTGNNIEALLSAIETVIQKAMIPFEVLLPYRMGELIALIHRQGVLESETHTTEGVILKGHIPPRLAARLPGKETS
jgi:GTP-binding protein HflX